jgi:hypothetical protein
MGLENQLMVKNKRIYLCKENRFPGHGDDEYGDDYYWHYYKIARLKNDSTKMLIIPNITSNNKTNKWRICFHFIKITNTDIKYGYYHEWDTINPSGAI